MLGAGEQRDADHAPTQQTADSIHALAPVEMDRRMYRKTPPRAEGMMRPTAGFQAW
jgi:hypothetical protein